MAPDLRPGPDSPPTDELDSAEASLRVLQQVLHTIAADDMSRRTPCAQFDVTQLTAHLLKSIKGVGDLAGAEIPDLSPTEDSVERQIILAARPALDAWHHHGLDGTVPFGSGEMPAKDACAILSIELLVHAWDYAGAVDHDVKVAEPLAEYVLGLAQRIIKPELRSRAGFDDPIDVAADADAVAKLVGFTGRDPASSAQN